MRNSRECVDVTVTADEPARIVFARLWFPGYTATLDGRPIDVVRHDGTLVAVDLPPGSDGELVISYRSPGFVPLAILALASIAALAVGQVLAHRRRSRPGPPTADDASGQVTGEAQVGGERAAAPRRADHEQ
jgi:uncharacterized membrane protein YfhO